MDVSWMCHVLVYSLCTMLANPFGLHIHDSLVELLTLIPNSTREGRKTKAMQKLYKLARYTIMHTIIRYFRVCRKQKRIPSHEHSRDSMLNVGHKFQERLSFLTCVSYGFIKNQRIIQTTQHFPILSNYFENISNHVKITTSNMLWHHFRDTVELEDLHEYGFKSMFAQVERGAMVSIVTMIHDVSCEQM